MLTCSGYILFFTDLIIRMIVKVQSEDNTRTEEDYKSIIFVCSVVLLIPLSLFEQMKHISYISIVAVVCIAFPLIYILVDDIVTLC